MHPFSYISLLTSHIFVSFLLPLHSIFQLLTTILVPIFFLHCNQLIMNQPKRTSFLDLLLFHSLHPLPSEPKEPSNKPNNYLIACLTCLPPSFAPLPYISTASTSSTSGLPQPLLVHSSLFFTLHGPSLVLPNFRLSSHHPHPDRFLSFLRHLPPSSRL